ncbi:MAG: hypothetical protein SCK29_09395 [Bacillota bacterium]|nr:hypothetical protein [Bacillota bacterium]
MKKLLPYFFLFLLLGTGSVHARLRVLPPEEMISSSRFIVAGEVKEIRDGQAEPEFVVDVIRVFQGEVGTARLLIPLPQRPGMSGDVAILEPPATGSHVLLFLAVNDLGRLVPPADLNWIGIMQDGRVASLYMGGRTHNWDEQSYIETYNRFLAENPGKEITPPSEDDEVPAPEEKQHGIVNPAIFFFIAGMMFILLIVSAKIKKSSASR